MDRWLNYDVTEILFFREIISEKSFDVNSNFALEQFVADDFMLSSWEIYKFNKNTSVPL